MTSTTSKHSSPDDATDGLFLLSSGYLRLNLNRLSNKQINPTDIATILVKMLITWTFHTVNNSFSRFHSVSRNNKLIHPTLECNRNSNCYCYFSSFMAMSPKSGIYKLSIKINQIDSNSTMNIIGLSMMHDCQSIYASSLWYNFTDYIGWSATPDKYSRDNNLLCGNSKKNDNIFYRNKFKYISNNGNYRQGLPGFVNNDVIHVEYDSYKNTLSFKKLVGDDRELDAQIESLPKGLTLYWFIGHFFGLFSVSVLEQCVEVLK